MLKPQQRSWERDQISERTTTAMQHKAAAGEFCGGLPPYGWTVSADGVTLEAHDAEQVVIALACELRAAGLSLRKVGYHLARRGLLPRTGNAWHPQTVKALLRETEKVAA